MRSIASEIFSYVRFCATDAPDKLNCQACITRIAEHIQVEIDKGIAAHIAKMPGREALESKIERLEEALRVARENVKEARLVARKAASMADYLQREQMKCGSKLQ